MLKILTLSAALLIPALVGPASAQSTFLAIENERVDFPLLTMVIEWAANISGLPATRQLPTIRQTIAAQVSDLEPRKATSITRTELAAASGRPDVQSAILYDDATRTIVLPAGWTSRTAADMSLLVHAVVNHLQNVGGHRYACPQARSALAYDAQDRWLQLFFTNLEDAFGIDPSALKMNTHCLP
ncbi:MAG: DUF6647 family protein [Beijerinckiaceae bacterium]